MVINEVHGVCAKCAKEAGFVAKDNVVGVWMGKCDICGLTPCSDLWHDWQKKDVK